MTTNQRPSRHHRLRSDRGEGVISTAIAVLVMAFLGAAMWISFNTIWKDTSENTENQVKVIGSDTESQPDAGG
jgi:type II secretory pathway component PulK